MLDSICNLRHLQALSLHYYGYMSGVSPTALQQHANSLQRLGALTALRRLHLSLHSRCHDGVSADELNRLQVRGAHGVAAFRAAGTSSVRLCQLPCAACPTCSPSPTTASWELTSWGAAPR